MKTKFDWFIFPFCCLFVLFALSRYSYVESFQTVVAEPFEFDTYLKYYWTGLLSDLWIAFLLTTVHWSFTRFLRRGIPGRMLLAGLATVVPFVLFLAHVGYFDFYRAPMSLHHFEYLADINFLRSNYESFFDWKILIIVFLTILFGLGFVIIFTKIPIKFRSGWRSLIWFFSLLLTCLAGHSANIHFRVQWDVPEGLAVNVVEYIYLNFKNSPFVPLLPPEARQSIELNWASAIPMESKFKVIDVTNVALAKEEQSIQSDLKRIISENTNTYITLVILESARHYDFGPNENNVSLTPFFDNLKQKGAYFDHAYSTSKVTRAAQEAILCGYYGNEFNSLMRHRQNLKFNCLPSTSSLIFKTHFNWIHGGRYSFDQQGNFWKAQGMQSIISQRDFAEDAARTDWGISDWELFRKAAKLMSESAMKQDGIVYSHAILSMTNHIPWNMPADKDELFQIMQPPLGKDTEEQHPSYRTIEYTDAALGWFVQEMKRLDIWNRQLLVVVGDHGLTVPPHNHPQPDENTLSDRLSHVPLLLSGGLIEQNPSTTGRTFHHFISQVDIAVTLGKILAMKGLQTSTPGIFDHRHAGLVYADLDQLIYFPSLNLEVAKEGFASDIEKAPKDEAFSRLFVMDMNAYLRNLDANSASQ